MTNYYIEKENKIVFIDTDKARLQRTVGKDVEIKETERPLVLSDDGTYFVFADTDEYLQEQAEKRKEEFNNNFVITSWGAFRKTPKGYSSAVESLNTVCLAVTFMKSLPEGILTFYRKPDFTKPEQCTEEWIINNSYKNEAMTLEEFALFYTTVITAWNTQEHL